MDIIYTSFFQRALIGGMLIGVAAPLIGIFLVLRRLSMIGDTLSHAAIAGVALGFLIGDMPIVFGMLFALIASFAIEKLRHAYKSYAELSLAIIMSAGIAIASILFTLGRDMNMDVDSFLFGFIYALSPNDIWTILAVAVVVVLIVAAKYHQLFLLTFDEEAASVSGINVKYYNILISVLTALVISISIKVVGGLLVSALLTIPAACSLIIARSFKQSIFIVMLVGELAVILGLFIAGVWNLAAGGTIVLALIVFLLLLLGWKGIISGRK